MRYLLLAFLLLCMVVSGQVTPEGKWYYGFEMNNQVVGYLMIESVHQKDKHIVRSELSAKFQLMGQKFNLETNDITHIDPDSGDILHYDSNILQGEKNLGATIKFKGGEAIYHARSGGKAKSIKTEGLVFESSVYSPHLRDVKGEKTFQVYSFEDGEVHTVKYTFVKAEEIVLAGKKYKSLIFDRIDLKTGVSQKMWFSAESTLFLKVELPNSARVYLSDPAIVGKMKRAKIDNFLFAEVEMKVEDFRDIEYLKVKVKLKTVGEWITVDKLNTRYQKFTGTVKDNVIDGIFEIAYKKYDGTDAPPFPVEKNNAKWQKYLDPSEFVESDDAVLVEKARTLTKDAKDSWHAVQLLSKWVAENIAYEIPGGSARQTYDSKKGECSSHSVLLAAFCRSVGIPARTVTGCMYTPLYGGSFGQHVWNEIYMGKHGWIAVDSTAHEIDYVDSAHLRLGERSSFNPESMKVLDFRTKTLPASSRNFAADFSKIPWESKKKYTYEYQYQGKIIGTDSFIIEDNGKEYLGQGALNLGNKTSESKWRIDKKGRPISFDLKGKAGWTSYTVTCRFREKEVEELVVKGWTKTKRTIPLKEKVHLFDNSNFGLFAFVVCGMPLKEGGEVRFKIFHPSSMKVLPMQIKVIKKEKISFGGKEVECWACDCFIAGTPLKLWVDMDGRLLQESEAAGRLVCKLQSQAK